MPTPAKILVVDDQQLVRETVCALLQTAASSATLDWQLYEAADGQAAVDRAREIQPDVVVMDIEMPKMSGLAAAQEVRQLSPATKIILMSGRHVKDDAAHLARLLGDGKFLSKSEIGKELVAAIRGLLPEESQTR